MPVVTLIGRIAVRTLLAFIFIIIVVPFGLVRQRMHDPLGMRGGPQWHKVDEHLSSTESARRRL